MARGEDIPDSSMTMWSNGLFSAESEEDMERMSDTVTTDTGVVGRSANVGLSVGAESVSTEIEKSEVTHS